MLTNNNRYRIIEWIAAIFVLLFLYTAISKLTSITHFANTMHKSPLLKIAPRFFAWMIPLAEILLVALLVIPKWRKTGLLGSLFLMTVFTLYIGLMIVYAPTLPCTCGGVIEELSWSEHLLFNGLFTLLALAGYALYPNIIIAINPHSNSAGGAAG